MGRSRRRNRRELFLRAKRTAGQPSPAEAAELGLNGKGPHGMLTPVYVSVGEAAREAERVAPILPLEGLSPWEPISGPALALFLDDADHAPAAERAEQDSTDPRQLELGSAGPAAEAPAAVVGERAMETAPTPAAEAVRIEARDEETQVELLVVSDAPAPAAEPSAPAAVIDEAATFDEPAPDPAPATPDPAEETFLAARLAAEEGRRGEAKTLYRELLGRRPSHVRARNNLALLLEADGLSEAALAEYDRALDTDPDNATLLVNRGSLLGQMGRYAAAERDLKRVLRAEPSHPDALFGLGVVMTKKGLWGEAVPQLRRVVELDPERGPAHFYLGEALNHVDDLSGAMAAYQRAAELMPDHPRALYGLGIVYDRVGRPDDAARMYRKSRDVGRGAR